MTSIHRPLWTLPPAEVYPALDTAIAASQKMQRVIDRLPAASVSATA